MNNFRFLSSFILLFFSIIELLANPYNFGHIDYSDGLSNNHVSCFSEDNNGFIWFGTRSGLNRYDGNNIKQFKHDPTDPTSLIDNVIEVIVKDQIGRFWIRVPNNMCLFNPNREEFTNSMNFICNGENYNLFNISLVVPYSDSTLFFRIEGVGIMAHNIFTNKNWLLLPDNDNLNSISTSNISSLNILGQDLYIFHRNGLIEIVDIVTRKVKKRITQIQELYSDVDHEYVLFIDKDRNLWIYCGDIAIGVYRINKKNELTHINTESKPALNSDIISGIIQDSDGDIWVGTDHGGVNILSNNLSEVKYITKDINNENSLSQNVVTSLYISTDSIIWVGTFKQGINYYHKNLFRFFHYTNYPNDKKSLPYNDVNCFAEDKDGNIWIGTNGQGLIFFDRKNNKFEGIVANPNDPNSFLSNVIVSIYIDRNNLLWIGTYHGGLSVYDGKKFRNFTHDPNNPKSINDNKIWDIFEDSKGNIWIGMLTGGLDMFNRKDGSFYHYSGAGVNSIKADFIMDIAEDKNGNIWFGTDYGVFVLDHESSRFVQYYNDKNDPSSLSNNFVYKVFVDSRGDVWIGTRDGLNLFNKRTNSFNRFNAKDGLADNSIMSILESDDGNLWLGTSFGLSKLIIKYNVQGIYDSHYTVNFNESDGLQGREFNEGSALKTKKGELIFGGANGFNLFKPEPDYVFRNKYLTRIVGLDVFGKEIDLSDKGNKNKIISTAVLNGETIRLNYAENMFSLRFVVIDFLNAKKITYRYKLDGFNDQWIYTNWKDRKATFTNLNPGKYVFKVQASDLKSDWEQSECFVNVIIAPPWYRTWWAYILYLILIIVIFLVTRNFTLARERNKFQKEQAVKESERQHELNVLKTRFFTNVSHEFRTPLTLIIAPLERLLKNDLNNDSKKHLELMYQNASRLLNLVNQLLDFRKAEANKLSLNLIYGNIIGLIERTVNSFDDLRESKKIELLFIAEEKELFMQFDKDKIEKIIINLLSNAFKFTPEGGTIKVITRLNTFQTQGEILEIVVEDNGIGIKEEYQDKIFDRFYQTDLPIQFIAKGSGIGLSLAKDFVDLHRGIISVNSKNEKGSQFVVQIPVNRTPITSEKNVDEHLIKEEQELNESIEVKLEKDKTKKTILLVEDNADFRFYIKDSLINDFNILEAENGMLALDILNTEHLDLIVSDVMMPEMDGVELCVAIKTNPDYSHIPIILLTAKSTDQDKIIGLEHGADEYLTKPFSFDILLARIEYLLGLREKFIKQYQETFKIETDNATISPLDKKLLEKTIEIIEEKIADSDFSVEKLSSDLGMSRVSLYKKMLSLTGKTPIELIRRVRLKKAAELLVMSHLTISEITYDVGYSDPRYFSKQFKAEFNVLPSKYRENQGLMD